jgi:putative transposase
MRYNVCMSRYRLDPSRGQEEVLLRHCSDARYVWNLAVEQHGWWRPGRTSAPGYLEQARQLTAARAASPWLREGSQMVQQQALRDFARAMADFFRGTHRRPRWRKAGRDEGFRVVAVGPGDVRRLNRNHAEVKVPKAGWVRFRLSRPVPPGVKSYRITRDRAGRWHVAFAAIPDPVDGPSTGEIVGIDRGVAVSAALSTGELLSCPGLTARETARRKDWCEKTSTSLARRFGVIRVEDLNIKNMTRSARGTVAEPGRNVAAKAGLNRGIQRSGWGLLVRRLEDKAPGRVEKVSPAFTSQCCSACGHVARESRESQALFRCVACGHTLNADVNAARNIAAGHAVNARGGDRDAGPANREPQLLAP